MLDSQYQSQSLLLQHTPRKSQSSAGLQGHSGLHSCAASDASLLSSLLDESCIQERTLVDSFWGLDEETDLKEHSVRSDRSMALSDQSMVMSNGDMYTAQTQTSVLNGYVCKDCTVHQDRKDALTVHSSSKTTTTSCSSVCRSTSANTTSAAAATAAAAATSLNTSSVVYSRDKTRKHKSGVLASLSDSCVRYSRRAGASVVSLVTLIVQNVLLKIRKEGSDVNVRAHSNYCGSMNVKDLVASDGHFSLNGSLCDDCKGKQHLETLTVQAQSSRARRLLGALWWAVASTGYYLLQAVRALGSAGWFVTRTLLSVLWLAALSPGKAAAGAFWWLGTAWYQLVTLMSLLNVFILTRVLPKLYKLLLFLLPFLLLLGLWYWCPSGLLSYLPAVNLTEWRTASPPAASWTPAPSAPLEQAIKQEHSHLASAPPPAVSQADAERLSRLEQSLARLWEGVQSREWLQEQQHGEVLGLYGSLREELDRQTDRDSMGLWVSGLLDQRLGLLREELQQASVQGEESQQQFVVQQQDYESRLAELETMLQGLAAKTEEVQQRQETATPAPVSVGVDTESHSALLGQVQKLEAELGRIRQDLQGVIGCQGRCERLDSLQDMVSAQASEQVRRELRALFYGHAQTEEGEAGELPEPLLPWLSAQFVRGADLQATLASLERGILGNLTLQLEQSRSHPAPKPSPRPLHTPPKLRACPRSMCS
ncbi:hypothetical protein AGOR_G00197600 [Albula goreensis]|uniref:SUN domain-containing protein n=1 Tax=Albula goreensis TaxID=1534307 RepID=A0A8T3CSP9_9TELE|nr:hypothetical protein AGOR_G00197600 [Albula goreensis]